MEDIILSNSNTKLSISVTDDKLFEIDIISIDSDNIIYRLNLTYREYLSLLSSLRCTEDSKILTTWLDCVKVSTCLFGKLIIINDSIKFIIGPDEENMLFDISLAKFL